MSNWLAIYIRIEINFYFNHPNKEQVTLYFKTIFK